MAWQTGKEYTKVNWQREETLASGFVCGVSDKSGICKVTFPGSYQTLMMYKDQFHSLGITHPEVVEYFNKNSDIIRDSKENAVTRKVNKDREKLINAIVANTALTDDQKQAMIKLVA